MDAVIADNALVSEHAETRDPMPVLSVWRKQIIQEPGAMKNSLGVASFGMAILAGVTTAFAWWIFFPFTQPGIRALSLFTFMACLASVCLGIAGLFQNRGKGREGMATSLLGIIIAVFVLVTLLASVG